MMRRMGFVLVMMIAMSAAARTRTVGSGTARIGSQSNGMIAGVVTAIRPSGIACTTDPTDCALALWTIVPPNGGAADTIVQTYSTRVEGDPGVGDAVEIATIHVGDRTLAIVITRSVPAAPAVMYRGVVSSIVPLAILCPMDGPCLRAFWTVGPFEISVFSTTAVVGSPDVGDTVDVIATSVSSPRQVALSIKKVAESTAFTGIVKEIVPIAALCPAGTTECPIARWTISTGPADLSVIVTTATKLTNDPKVGDTVEVIARHDGEAYTAIAIRRAD